jgi:hypothetical protein
VATFGSENEAATMLDAYIDRAHREAGFAEVAEPD